MSITLLPPDQIERLRRLEPNYALVDATRAVPPGYASFSHAQQLPRGFDFDAGAKAVLSWQIQSRAGLRVAASDLTVRPGSVVVLGLGPSRLHLVAVRAPCRVTAVVDEPDRRGFTYGTLPGHPEAGEESFVLERRADGSAQFLIAAYSRPATRLARLAGPLGSATQRYLTSRYLDALTG